MSTCKRTCEPVKGGQGWHRLTILDLRDVRSGHTHARGKLALREIAHVAQVTHGSCHLQAFDGWLAERELSMRGERGRLRNLDLEGYVAATAECICRAELHQVAFITTQNFTLFDGRHHGCHKLCTAGRTQSKDRHHTSDNGSDVTCLE